MQSASSFTRCVDFSSCFCICFVCVFVFVCVCVIVFVLCVQPLSFKTLLLRGVLIIGLFLLNIVYLDLAQAFVIFAQGEK